MLSLLAIGTLNTGPDAGSSASSNDVAAKGDPVVVAEYPIVGQEAMVALGQVVVETTGAAFAGVNLPPSIDSVHTTRPPTTTNPPSTTTTIRRQNPPTTTTILPATATTQVLSPATTALPATTTTAAPVSAPTGDHFTTLLTGVVENGPNEQWWDAPYYRSLPYAAGTGWTDGDRSGYRCFYAFLLHEGQVVGRVTFTRVPEADSYASINDRYMEEGVRYYNGALAPADAPRELGECPAPSTAYEPATGSDQRPTITYTLGQTLLEVRNYKKTVVGAGITFRQVESTASRITVVAYKDNLPAIVIYYDSMVPGLVMNSDLG
ncbi:MAG TPA: hypothetical protein VJQ79_00450 [Acidimicrobiia bacterium]|nr:hypothetical protein [Acidimicrobiia bacterium]